MPAEELFLPWAVVRRAVTVSAISATIHHIPIVGSKTLLIVSAIFGIIKIRQTHYVTKLMAQCTNTAQRTTGQLA